MLGPRPDITGCIQFVYRLGVSEGGRTSNEKSIEVGKKRIFRPKSANLGMVGREAPRAAPWAIWDDPGLYGYLQGVIYTVVGLASGGAGSLIERFDLAQSQSRTSVTRNSYR